EEAEIALIRAIDRVIGYAHPMNQDLTIKQTIALRAVEAFGPIDGEAIIEAEIVAAPLGGIAEAGLHCPKPSREWVFLGVGRQVLRITYGDGDVGMIDVCLDRDRNTDSSSQSSHLIVEFAPQCRLTVWQGGDETLRQERKEEVKLRSTRHVGDQRWTP